MKIKILVDGNKLAVLGDTFQIRDTLKKYGLKWDPLEREWYDNLENHTSEEIKKLAREVGAELIVAPLSTLPQDVLEFIPEKAKKVISELLFEQ